MAKNFDHLSHLKSSATRDVTSEEFFGLTPTSDNSEDSGSSPIKMNLSKRPTADNLVEGEIAVNYLKGHETLSIKNSEGEIVGFISENEIQENNEILVKGISQEAKDRIDACEAISKKIETHEAESAYQTIEVTMEELYNLKSTEKLKPGNSYRITEYNTKTNTSMTDIRSQEFHYDVIVTATSTTTLSEIAKAAKAKVGSASSQFDDCNLDAWELRFRMGFDKEEFPWAYYSGDTTKYGVVYYMKDEHGNEAPYDFKNIQFKRYKTVKGTSAKNDWMDGVYAAPSTSLTMGDVWGYGYTVSKTDFNWFYTFSALKVTWDSTNHKFTAPTAFTADSDILDASVANVKNLYYSFQYEYNLTCSNNVIKPCYVNNRNEKKAIHNLNNNIMLGWYGDYSSMEADYQSGASNPALTYRLPHDNYFASDCKNNTLSIGSWGNKLSEGCYLNVIGNFNASTTDIAYGMTFGKNCYQNSFGNGCYSNKFGDSCYDNVSGNKVYKYTVGNKCYSNYFNSSSYSNTLKDDCYSNTVGSYGNLFGNGCYQNIVTDSNNSFGNSCYTNTVSGQSNSFGNKCYDNTVSGESNSFGELCYTNTVDGSRNSFGELCYTNTVNGSSNSFGKNTITISFDIGCDFNKLGNNCEGIVLGRYCRYNHFSNDNKSIKMGKYCNDNVFGPSCQYIWVYVDSGTVAVALTNFLGYFQNNVFETNKYLNITTTKTTSTSNLIRNNYFALGINNTTTNKTITINTLNATYKTTYQNASSTTVSV